MSMEQIHQLRETVQAGQLSGTDAQKQLAAAIETEYGKADADMAYINACEDLLLALGSAGDAPLIPSTEQYAAQMQDYMHSRQPAPARAGAAWRYAAAAAAMLVLVLGAWLFIRPGDDPAEARRTSEARPADVQTIRQSIADHDENSEFATDDLNEVIAFLGFVPKLPELPELDITSTGYRVQVAQDRILLTACHGIGDAAQNVQLQYTIQYCADADVAYMLYEQEDNGDISIIHGKVVYLAPQADRTTYTWFEGATVYRLVWDHAIA